MIDINATLIAQILNFLILAGLLRAVAYKPVVRMLKARQDRIQESLDKADADAAFESINNLVDYFVQTILNIEVGSGEEKTTLGESLGISKSDFDKTKVTDIVKSVSPKLIGPLSSVRKALDSNYSANGKEQIMRDVFGLSSTDTIQPYYDLYLNYL